MSASAPSPMFPCDGYEIRDERLAEYREVVIRSDDGPTPRRGDLFTIISNAVLHDLMVLDVLRAGSDWTARCRVVGVA